MSNPCLFPDLTCHPSSSNSFSHSSSSPQHPLLVQLFFSFSFSILHSPLATSDMSTSFHFLFEILLLFSHCLLISLLLPLTCPSLRTFLLLLHFSSHSPSSDLPFLAFFHTMLHRSLCLFSIFSPFSISLFLLILFLLPPFTPPPCFPSLLRCPLPSFAHPIQPLLFCFLIPFSSL